MRRLPRRPVKPGDGSTAPLPAGIISSSTTVILPGFLAVLCIPAAVPGLIEGVADAVASFTKMVSGFIADKLGHRKLLVLIGYGLTPIGQYHSRFPGAVQ